MTNETIKTLLGRRSIRKFKQQQITDEELKTVLEAGMYAPSGANQQSPLFIAVQDRETLKTLNALNASAMGKSGGDPYYGAPTVILVLADKSKVTPVEDASLALGNMFNAAASIGLGTCWIHREKQMFESSQGRELLKKWGVNGEYIGVGSCAIGYPDCPTPEAPTRKDGYVVYIR